MAPAQRDILGDAAARPLRDLAAGPLGELIDRSFRVVPQQERAMASVERLLAAVPHLAETAAGLERLTLDALARDANVTPQAAYRYFRDAFDVVRLFARRVQTVAHEQLLELLLERRFETNAEIAEVAVGFVVAALQPLFAIPVKLRIAILRDHLEICYALIWTVSELASAAIARRGDPCAGMTPLALNAALVATVAVAASFCERGDPRLTDAGVAALLQALFVTALERGDAGPDQSLQFGSNPA